MLELDCGAEFDAARDEEFFTALPPRPAVVLIEPARSADLGEGSEATVGTRGASGDTRAVGARGAGVRRPEPYLLRTADLRRRAHV